MGKEGGEGDVIEWLKEREFSDECIKLFTENGYKGIEAGDLEDKDIDKVLKKQPGLAKKVKQALAEWKAENKEPESAEIPDLPEGKEFDLSLSEVTVGDETFKIPDALSVKAKKPRSYRQNSSKRKTGSSSQAIQICFTGLTWILTSRSGRNACTLLEGTEDHRLRCRRAFGGRRGQQSLLQRKD